MFLLQFWKSWTRPYQVIFWTLAAAVCTSIFYFWMSWLASPAPVIVLDHFQQVKRIEVPSHFFQVGLTRVVVPADSYVIFENIFGSKLQPNIQALQFFLVALAVSFVFFISIATMLTRYRFLIGMGLVILFLASLRFDALEIFGLTQVTTTVVVLLFSGLAFYFNAFKKEVTFIPRFLSFALLVAIVLLLTLFCSRMTSPFLHLAVNGLITGMILCIVLILMVAHEIVAAFITITTQSLKSSKSLQHFLILSVIYLTNLALLYASKMGFIGWSFFSVSSFFILTVSAVLGIWGFRQRSTVYEHIFPGESTGIFFFMSVMTTGISAMAYFAASASDMMMDALDDLILAAHLGGGIIFLLYVIANFGPMLVKNLPVHKILYKPETMPYFTFRLMSVIAIFAVISMAVSWKTYVNQATASFYNAHGDLYLAEGNDVGAEAYYAKAIQFRNQNLHAHYALASIHGLRNDSFKETKEYEKSAEWTPSVPVYLNLSEIYAGQRNLLEAALILDEGKKSYPKSGELLNAIGLSFTKLNAPDSALYFFQQAKKTRNTRQVGEGNFLAASTLFKQDIRVDSILMPGDHGNSTTVNTLAYANQHLRRMIVDGKWQLDTALSVYQAMLLCNFFVNQMEKVDTALIAKAVKLANRPANAIFSDRLLVASAQAMYAHGNVKSALQILREVAYRAGDGHYFQLLGLWLLEQNNPLAASGYFKAADEKYEPLAPYYQAVAETEADSLQQAVIHWDSLSHGNEKSIAAFAAMMKKVLMSTQTSLLSDDERYYFCRYKVPITDSLVFERITSGFTQESIRARALFDRSKKWYELDEPLRAWAILQQISPTADRTLRKEIDALSLRIKASEGDWDFVGKKLNGEVDVSFNERVYFEALQMETSGNTRDAAVRYHYLLNANSQFNDGIVAASRFFASDTTDRMKNFSLLVDGLLAKPNDMKILKQHVLMCIQLGFVQEAQDSLDRLQRLLPKASFQKFIATHRDLFGEERKQ